MNLRSVLLASSVLCVTTLTAAAQVQPSDPDVVKVSTTLVRMDVTATDKSGRSVRDLQPDDIEVYENGTRQKVVSLTFVSPPAAQRSGANSATGQSAASVPDNGTARTTGTTPTVTRRFVVAVDDYTMSAESMESTRKELHKYIDANFRPGDAVAVVVLSKVTTPVVRFYLTKDKIDEAISSIAWNPAGIGEAVAIPPTDPDLGMTAGAGSTFKSAAVAQTLIRRLQYLLAAIKSVPGRVPLIFFSDGFVMPPDEALGETDRNSVLDPLLQLIDTANRQATSFYTIDSRGLLVSGIRASDGMAQNPTASQKAALQNMLNDRKARMDQISKPQDTLDLIARSTGGVAYRDRNDIATALEQAMDDRSYYLLAYEPSAEDFDPKVLKMNKIKVTTNRKGVQLRYRSSFASR